MRKYGLYRLSKRAYEEHMLKSIPDAVQPNDQPDVYQRAICATERRTAHQMCLPHAEVP